MPNFSINRILNGATLTAWSDPATGSAASRLNAFPDKPLKYWKVTQPIGFATVDVQIPATVNGVEAPGDAALGGKLFTSDWSTWSGTFPPAISFFAALTSLQIVTITSAHIGFFCLRFARQDGGAILVPFMVEP